MRHGPLLSSIKPRVIPCKWYREEFTTESRTAKVCPKPECKRTQQRWASGRQWAKRKGAR